MEKTAFSFFCSGICKRAFVCLFILIHANAFAQNDLPVPSANYQNIPAGSFIIPMDNNYQSIVPAGQAPFNLKSYGLVNSLLQNGIPVKWIINSNKQRDDIDLTAIAERVAPGFIAGATIDFRGGPFIVPDTVLPCGQTTTDIINAFGNNVAVYKLLSNTSADVRYTVTHRPKIAVFNNGGNQLIHTKILDAAGITYDIMDAAHIEELKNCYTFASEPHADDSQVSLAVINGVKAFVLSGGNFLAQCHAIETYESRGFFQTTAGIESVNIKVSHHYPNADMAFAQMHGPAMENAGGSVDNYKLKAGSTWKPYTYPIITNLNSDTIIATGAHLIAPAAPGGNVFYLGGHDYSKSGGKGNTAPNLSNIAAVNDLRLYLNASLIPSGNTHGIWANAGEASHILSCTDSVTLGCTEVGPPGSTFLWSPPEGLSCTTCPNPVAKPKVTTTYTLQVTNTCIARDTVRVIVAPKPVAQFNNTTVCQGEITTFTNQSSNSNYWKWNFGDPALGSGNTSTAQNPSLIFSSSGNFTVTLISGTDPSCADTIVKIVTVKPTSFIKVNSDTICLGQSILLTASGASTYSWSTGATTSSINVKPTTSASYVVRGLKDGCYSSDTARITVSPMLIPTTISENVSCSGGTDGTASVTVSGGIPGYLYSWNSTPVQTTPKATGLPAGNYTVKITDAAGCSSNSTVSISQPAPLSANVISTDALCNSNDGSATVTISGGTPSYSYNWNTAPIQTTPKAINLSSGNYIVTITDSKGCSITALASIVEFHTMTLSTVSTNVSCNKGSDGTATVIPTGGVPAYSYSWNSIPAQSSAQAVNLQAGVYTVTVTDSNGCISTTSAKVEEPTPISLSVDFTNPTCISGGVASITATGGTPSYSYRWNSEPEQTTPTAINLPAGSFNVTIKDLNNCKIDTTITLAAPPEPVADFSFNSTCLGSPITFTDHTALSSGNIIKREWNFGDQSSGNSNMSLGETQTHTYGTFGTFNTSLTVTTNLGCKDTILKPIEVYPIPVVKFGPFAKGCGAICVDFKDSSSVPNGFIQSWYWNFGDPNNSNNTSFQQNPNHCYNQPGNYAATLEVVSNHGCSSQLTIPDIVKVYKKPSVDLGPDQKICTENEANVFRVLNAGPGRKYLWQPSGDTVQTIYVYKPGTYNVTVTDENNCSATERVNVREVCPPRLFVGNAFSPDGDGINDRYVTYSAHVDKFQLLIFNRWGEIIFESRNPEHHWDGIYREEPMPVGVYAWIITYEGDSEEFRGPYKLEGSVTVVR
ncbi:MAG: gliding motility-associated C-terminal domain-containing protein [Sporocytophaga sp.]|uniref:PKD domain-containing protein n=1 Tax=Sporocytophaga sp. TaxID=2231183 RepID=UPI001B029796|nr:PKD domain-containing protein [Sporocytophaga sp.]MBO9699087.1 gliding motility-associated C-terminal domain-containing protein [Sporocytophaga sp.]